MTLRRRTPAPDRFAAIVARALRRQGERRPIVYDDAAFALRIGASRVHLATLYAEYAIADPTGRRGLLRTIAGAFETADHPPATWDEARPHLLPRVRDALHHRLLALAWQLEDGPPVPPAPHRPLGPHHTIELAFDTPMSSITVTVAMLDGWGVGLDEALSVATGNLATSSREAFRAVGAGVWASPWRDAYDASRLALPALLAALDIAGDPVAFAPARDALLVTGADDPAGLATAAARAVRLVREEPRAMSGAPLRLVGDAWTSFTVDPGHVAHAELERLGRVAGCRAYAEQASLLVRLADRGGEDVFVASLLLVELAEGARTFTTWSSQVPLLLPRADRIAFLRESEDGPHVIGTSTWAHVATVTGLLDHPTPDLDPPRYRVDRFPTPSELQTVHPP